MENVQDGPTAAADVPVAAENDASSFEYTNTQPFTTTETAQYAEFTNDGQDIAVEGQTVPTDATPETTPGGGKVKKARGEKRKYRNPSATRPPTFTGAVGEEKSEAPQCHNCQSTVTPLWRRGPEEELLCNACGLFFKLHKKMRPSNLAKPRVAPTGENAQKVECNNCGKVDTPMWRKEPDTGKLLCNACALYRKLHGTSRPEGTTQGGGKKRRRNKAGGPDDSIGDSSLEHVHGADPTSLPTGTVGADAGQTADQATAPTVPWDEPGLGHSAGSGGGDGGDIPAAPAVGGEDRAAAEERTANIHPDFRVPAATGDQDLAQQAAAQYLAHANSGADLFANTEGAAAWHDVQGVGGTRA